MRMAIRRAISLLSRVMVPEPAVPPEIELSAWETKIFRFLRRVASVSNTADPVELRVAGGWVRDKILHRATGDIDIAVQNTTGYQFASRVRSFAQEKASEFSDDAPNLDQAPRLGCEEYIPEISAVTCIDANPSMSRHLETATVRFDGHALDFVQLRTEDYALSASHRIPHTVSAGTPEQDAARRDFTVNALFYNLQTEMVEDCTGHGLEDLSDGMLRTPLDANITLLEDPLRALRAIRFACRLQFDLHPSLCNALRAKDVRESLRRKVSRERVGSEMDQILDSPDVVRGLEMIAKYHLVEPVFLESFNTNISSDEANYLHGLERVKAALNIVQENEHLFTEREKTEFRAHGREVLVYALLISDTTRIRRLLRGALKRTTRLQQDVRQVILWSIRLEELVREWCQVLDDDDQRIREQELWVQIAEIVRDAGDGLWLAAVVACSAKMGRDEVLPELLKSGVCSNLCGVLYAVDGNRLQTELGIPPGPEVGKALKELMRVQLLHYKRREDITDDRHASENQIPSPEVYVELLKAKLSSAGSRVGR